jgi:hypothetical protein
LQRGQRCRRRFRQPQDFFLATALGVVEASLGVAINSTIVSLSQQRMTSRGSEVLFRGQSTERMAKTTFFRGIHRGEILSRT